jgi:hypothetical protein
MLIYYYAQVHCEACVHDLFLAFSWIGRAVCPCWRNRFFLVFSLFSQLQPRRNVI